ncbi:LytTR family DNA-binding domain-containing protein [Aquimarina sp. MMG016]|uniref:LytR/AlgR family response regulator transcription factor n=1 Tax=Aquimarina sp. MMG016 TaxID=2822690 RepID=UPI001B39E624|nr:LytTR family DNA-binding domain-containing protein [Aquimarina sp. MMG016]MBQ4821169.1 response regulator transcription factor [Aquimarina sp. MMG016]
MIHCLILEDEASAIEVLQNYVDKTPFIDCLGAYESGLDIPLEQLRQTDLLFLDIQLPELNGLSFLKTLHHPPKVIVTSAYPGYAIEAFEEAVTDYLVKPFSYERFYKSVSRVRGQLLPIEKNKNKQLFLYADKTIYKTNAEDILFLKAEVDYVKVVTTDKQILILDSLQNWEEKLSKLNFIRTHRSYIVNLDRVEKISRNQIFIENDVIPIGRTYKESFINTLKK